MFRPMRWICAAHVESTRAQTVDFAYLQQEIVARAVYVLRNGLDFAVHNNRRNCGAPRNSPMLSDGNGCTPATVALSWLRQTYRFEWI